MNKSRRNWTYSGYKECHECVKVGREKTRHYDTWISNRPSVLILCADCYEWIYVHNRKQPTLIDLMENENEKGGELKMEDNYQEEYTVGACDFCPDGHTVGSPEIRVRKMYQGYSWVMSICDSCEKEMYGG
jgi:hypothetical protein